MVAFVQSGTSIRYSQITSVLCREYRSRKIAFNKTQRKTDNVIFQSISDNIPTAMLSY